MAQRHHQEYDDLGGLDLSKLDLDDIDLDDDAPSSVPRWFALITLLGAGGFVLWFPNSEAYRGLSPSHWSSFLLSAVAIGIGIGAGRIAWRMFEDAAARYARRRAHEAPRDVTPPKPASALTRFVIFLLIVTGVTVILYVLPSQGMQSEDSRSAIWFVAAILAIVIGFTAGRWLLMQAEAHAKPAERREPIVLPPWLKWVTLAVLIAAGATALIVPSLSYDGGDNSSRFGFGAVGLVVGIAGAIWLARRFDETEARIKEQALRARARPRA
ncbi:MAG: hypothetical protein HY903_18660 [Deltaproteobacteria bacterium]|nr:hypothetical protein [Deltaproteobacteria bacterium]